jgi:hypothetical protein
MLVECRPDPAKTFFVDCRASAHKLSRLVPIAMGLNERRGRGVRYPCELEAYCQPAPAHPGAHAWAARARNVSEGGIALMLARRFDPGVELAIELLTTTPGRFLWLAASVVHARPMAHGGWILGCRFVRPLRADELQLLVAAPGVASGLGSAAGG